MNMQLLLGLLSPIRLEQRIHYSFLVSARGSNKLKSSYFARPRAGHLKSYRSARQGLEPGKAVKPPKHGKVEKPAWLPK